MAKKSLIQREKKRQKLEKKYHLIRGSLKKKIRSKVSPLSLSLRPALGRAPIRPSAGCSAPSLAPAPSAARLTSALAYSAVAPPGPVSRAAAIRLGLRVYREYCHPGQS